MNIVTAFSRSQPNCVEDNRSRIDGISVHDLFDRLYDETREMARRFGKEVRFEVIAWSDLSMAADSAEIAESLLRALRWCLASDDTHHVTVRAYPCHDDVWVVFDIQADLYCDKLFQPEAWKPTLGFLRTAVQRIGGEWEPVASYSDCRRISFRLPQRVMPATELKRHLLQAS